ncbi:MAG: sensor domain-containing diguanylate cyclase [Cellvibrionaceae bacterium]
MIRKAKGSLDVDQLMATLEDNYRIQQHYHQFEFQLLSCTRLKEVFSQLLDVAQRHFELSDVRLALEDPDGELVTLFKELQIGDFDGRLMICATEGMIEQYYTQGLNSNGEPAVKLMSVDEETGAVLFPGSEVRSVALLPLKRHERLMGSWHFGSKREDRFSRDKGVEFISHMSLLAAVCIENAIRSERLRMQSLIDGLTGVRNRRSFDTEFYRELERANRGCQPITALFVDIDHFKQVNDTHGHQIGDECLREVAHVIKNHLRPMDTVARYGGEEFVVLLNNCDQQHALSSAERIRIAISNIRIHLTDAEPQKSFLGRKLKNESILQPTASLGLATWSPNGGILSNLKGIGDALLNAADTAMYDAKKGGRNRVSVKDFSLVNLAAEKQSRA